MKDKGDNYRIHWLNQLKSLNLKPEIFVIEEVSEENWQEAERFWIAYFRYIGADLTNSTDGGEGSVNLAPEIRAKISKSLSGENHPNWGKPKSAETRAKLSVSNMGKHSGEKSPLYGKPMPIERRLKISDSHKHLSPESIEHYRIAATGSKNPAFGKSWPTERREAQSARIAGKNNPHYGKKHTSEALAKISAKSTGRYVSPETRAKHSADTAGENNPMFGRKQTPEARAKISEAAKKRWAKVRTSIVADTTDT